MTKNISDENKTIARIVSASFGGTPKVDQFHDDLYRSTVAILSVADSPTEGFTSFSTIGLSDNR